MLLKEYVDLRYNGNQSELAKEIGRFPQVISNWIRQGYIVIDGMMYKPVQRLPTPFKLPHKYRKMSCRKAK